MNFLCIVPIEISFEQTEYTIFENVNIVEVCAIANRTVGSEETPFEIVLSSSNEQFTGIINFVYLNTYIILCFAASPIDKIYDIHVTPPCYYTSVGEVLCADFLFFYNRK